MESQSCFEILICISLTTKDVLHILKCLSAILYSFVDSFLFFYWIICSFDDQFLSSLYILEISPLSDVELVKIFPIS